MSAPTAGGRTSGACCSRLLAYTLVEALRRLALQGTALAQATCATIRTKLIKIGAVIVAKLSIVRLHLSSHHSLHELFRHVCALLVPPWSIGAVPGASSMGVGGSVSTGAEKYAARTKNRRSIQPIITGVPRTDELSDS